MPSWFEIANGAQLQQGDFLFRCPVPILPTHYPPDFGSTGEDAPLVIEGILETRDVIVLSQSCDLINRKISSVLVCPFWPIEQLPELANDEKLRSEPNRLKSLCNVIREGYSPRFHMIEKVEITNHEREIVIVDFASIYTVPFGFLETFADYSGERVRLISPYTEHLSQAFARYIMRVGLPSPIEKF